MNSVGEGMKTRIRILFFLLLVVGGGISLLLQGQDADPSSTQVAGRPRSHPYHDSLPSTPLPQTLDPGLFAKNRIAFVAYSLAAQIKPTLYQVPCYCGCDKEQGHQCLLDCFTSRHGVLCHTCQKEAMFCYLQHKKGKNPAQIREAIDTGRPSELDLKKYTDRFYRNLQKSYK
jgi:Protein of unknown function with PCYCGC motif